MIPIDVFQPTIVMRDILGITGFLIEFEQLLMKLLLQRLDVQTGINKLFTLLQLPALQIPTDKPDDKPLIFSSEAFLQCDLPYIRLSLQQSPLVVGEELWAFYMIKCLEIF